MVDQADLKPRKKFRDRINDWKECLFLTAIFAILAVTYIFISGGLSEPPAVRYVSTEPRLVAVTQHARSLLELDDPSEESMTPDAASETTDAVSSEDTSEGSEGNAAASMDALEIDPTITPARTRRIGSSSMQGLKSSLRQRRATAAARRSNEAQEESTVETQEDSTSTPGASGNDEAELANDSSEEDVATTSGGAKGFGRKGWASARRSTWLPRQSSRQQEQEAIPEEEARSEVATEEVEEGEEPVVEEAKPTRTSNFQRRWNARQKRETEAAEQQASAASESPSVPDIPHKTIGQLNVLEQGKVAKATVTTERSVDSRDNQQLKPLNNTDAADEDGLPPLSEECQVYLTLTDPDEIPRYDDSLKRIKGLILCGIPFALAKYDHENVFLTGKDYHILKRTGNRHPMPLRSHDTSYQILRIDLLDSLKHSRRNFFYALPIPPCIEGYDCKYMECKFLEEEPAGGGNVNRAVTLIGNLKYQKMGWVTYSSIFTRSHFDDAKAFFLGLLTGPDNERVNVMAFEKSLVDGLSWADRIVQIPSDSIQYWAARRGKVLAAARELAVNAPEPSIFMMNVGPLSPILISEMYKAAPKNLYIDVDGVLDEVMTGVKRFQPTHFSGLPDVRSRVFDKQSQCTLTAYDRVGDCVAPAGTVPKGSDGTDAELSRLCYQKGAHGKPVMGRVGGYFPERMRNVLKTQRLRHPDRIAPSREAQVARGADFEQKKERHHHYHKLATQRTVDPDGRGTWTRNRVFNSQIPE